MLKIFMKMSLCQNNSTTCCLSSNFASPNVREYWSTPTLDKLWGYTGKMRIHLTFVYWYNACGTLNSIINLLSKWSYFKGCTGSFANAWSSTKRNKFRYHRSFQCQEVGQTASAQREYSSRQWTPSRSVCNELFRRNPCEKLTTWEQTTLTHAYKPSVNVCVTQLQYN